MFMIADALFTIISVVIECIMLIYYCNSVMEYKSSRLNSNLISALGYLIYCLIVCFFSNTALNITGFIAVNFIVLMLGYKGTIKDIIFKVAIFTVLMMASELIASLIIGAELNNDLVSNITIIENLLFSFISKLLYATFVVIFKHLSASREYTSQSKETLYLILLPIETCIFLSAFNKIRGTLGADIEIALIIFGIMLIISNFIVYIICERIIDKNMEIQQLKEIEHKKETDEKSYQILKDKYEDMQIMVHDFNKYYNCIEAMLGRDQNEVKELTRELKAKNRELLLAEYTNNKTLNVLLSQKLTECKKLGIDFEITVLSSDISFISEYDTIAIFANLLDNAIESCKYSVRKKILLDIHTMNDSFLVICVNNSSDTRPNVYDGILQTAKADKEKHGIGMTSIKKAIEKYKGKMQWSYDEDKEIFNTAILITFKNYKKNN